MKVKTIRLYKDTDEVIVEESRIREFSDLGYQPEPVGERGDVGESGKGDGGKAKGRKAKDEAAQDRDAAGGA
jgi:hypothetical protein